MSSSESEYPNEPPPPYDEDVPPTYQSTSPGQGFVSIGCGVNTLAMLSGIATYSNAIETPAVALTQAIRSGNPELAETLLDEGADPNGEDDYGPALTQAIRKRYTKLARKLLDKGANANAQDTYGPALTQAIRKECPELAEELLRKGADPDTEDDHGTALVVVENSAVFLPGTRTTHAVNIDISNQNGRLRYQGTYSGLMNVMAHRSP